MSLPVYEKAIARKLFGLDSLILLLLNALSNPTVPNTTRLGESKILMTSVPIFDDISFSGVSHIHAFASLKQIFMAVLGNNSVTFGFEKKQS